MSQFELKLFLGFVVDSLLEKEIEGVNPHLLTFFTGGGAYLEHIQTEKGALIGKYIPLCITLESLQMGQAHVISILQKIAPHYISDKHFPHLYVL